MTTFFVEKNQVNDNKIQIFGDDFHHIKNVLRLKLGEELNICADGERYLVKIFEFGTDYVTFEILNKLDYTTELPVNITLFQGLPKQDKMELITQKATELGVREIVPVAMEHSVAKLDSKNETKKIDRWQKIAKEASSQSGRQIIPRVLPCINFKNIIENIGKYDIVLLPYENENGLNLKQCLSDFKKNHNNIDNIAVIIGPEGGFSEAEISSIKDNPKVQLVTLGKRILRTETAGIACISMIAYEFDM